MKKEPITLPVLSDTMETGHLARWLKAVGDPVKKGDVLAEVESDKAMMEVEAFEDGYLAGPLAQAGTDIPVRAVIGYIVDSPPDSAASEPPPAHPEPVAEPAPAPEAAPRPADAPEPSAPASPAPRPSGHRAAPAHRDSRAGVSPYARGLANELDVDLANVKPGPDGVIRAAQVIAAAMQGPSPDLDAGPAWHYKLLTPMHRAVAENMIATLSTPTFRVSSQLSIDTLHQAAKEARQSLSLLLARALALSVHEHPRFNEVYTPAALVVRERVDVGIAVDVPGGLVTPVIRDAAGRPVAELAEDWRILKDKVNKQRLVPEDYSGATVYLSNLGLFDVVSSFEAIVPLGAAAILAVGAAHGGIASFTLSCDHRVVYGADAARLMQTLADLLATPGDWL